MSSAKIKNSFTKWGIHPHDNEAPDFTKLSLVAEHSSDSTILEGRKLNAATQTPSTQSFETKRLRENSVLVALGAQRQIISKGCDDSVLCSYRFEALLFSKREKWIEFVFEAELMPYGSRTEASINLTKDSNSIISSMIKIEKDFIGESVNWNLEGDPSSFSIKTQDNLPIEIDLEGEIGLGLGEEELLNPPIKMEVEDLRDQGKEIIYKELLDPLAELDVDAELLGSSLHDNSVNGAKPELDPPPDLGWNDPLLVKEEWDDEKYSYPPRSSEVNLERELAFKFAEKIKEQNKFFSESTRKGSDDTIHIESHMKSVHEKIKSFKCLECNYSCSRKSTLARHIKSVHEKIKPFKCKECYLSFGLKRTLAMHMKSIHEKLKPFKCIKCNYSCSLKHNLESHIMSVHEKLKPFKCIKCNYSCSLKGTLARHMKSVHEKIKPFKCMECNSSFSQKHHFLQHIQSVHDKIKPFKCLECNSSFSQKQHFLQHIKSVHEKIKPFKCLECNYSCSLKSTLAIHMSVHEKIKPFKCLECNYSCSLKSTLAIHIKSVHDKLRPFKCIKCNYSGSQKGHLESHMMSVHEKIKPFKCLECNYSCSSKYTLTNHTKSVHSKIKPFKCLECNYSFGLKGNLFRHMRSVHYKIQLGLGLT